MVKSFKKAIAILVSVLMIATSLPFTALTASAAVSIPSNLSAQTANAKPESFNGVGKLSTANAPAGTYSNLVYQGTDKDEKGEDKQYLGHGVIAQKKTAIVYDGAHEASAPVYAKFWPTGSSKVQLCYTYISNSKPVALNEWVGSYKTNTTTPTLPYNPNGDTLLNYKSHDANQISFTTSDHSKCGSGEAWIFWTGQRYTGVGNTTDYYEKISGVTYQTGHRNDNWGWGNRTYDYTPSADVYVLNYKPVYEVLSNTAKVKVNETNTEYTFKDLFNTVWGHEDSYTTDSLQAYYNAVSNLVGLNVNSYYSSANDSNVEAQTQSAANAIKSAYNNYVSAVNALKRQYKVTVVDANDVVKASGYFEAGTDVSAFVNSYLPANSYDALKHYNYSWTPAISTVSDDVTYKVTVASGNHTMQNNGDPTPATCTEDGSQPTKCVACNFTSSTVLTKTGHSFTIYLNAYTTNTEFDESATYQHAAGCNNNCGEVDYKDCTFGAWTTVDGDSTKEYKRCTVCGGQVVRDKALDKVTITFELPNGTVVDSKTVDVNAEVDAPSLDAYTTIDAEGHHTYSWTQAKYSSATDTTITATADEVVVHSYGEPVDDNNATCTTDGTKTAKCTVSADCTFDDVQTISNSAKGHDWVNPTENLDDTHTFTCANGCGETKTEDCSFTVEKENVPATCTVDGYVINACDVCGKEKRTTNTALGHDYSSAVTDPTCTESGYTTYTCTRGDSQYKADYTDPTGHSWSKNVVESTCTENAYTINACANCEETKDKTDLYALTEVKDIDSSVQYLDIKGNNKQVTEFDLGFDVEEVTFTFSCHTYNGLFSDSKIYVYDYSGNKLKEYNANSLMENQTITLNNTRAYIKVDYQPTDGKDFFTVSSVKVLDSQFKAKGHDYSVDLGNGVDATCTEDGRDADMKCSRCEDVKTGSTIGKLGHSFTNYVSNDDATCQKNATQTAQCDRCDATDTKDIDNSTVAHSYELTDTVEAGHTENGKNVYTCKWCDDTYEEPIYAAGHTAGASVIEDAVNVDANGVATSCDPTLEYSYNLVTRCTECTEIMTSVPTTVNPLAHTEVTDDAVVADCITEGLTEGKHCSVCETVIVAQTNIGKDATKHAGTVALDESTVVAATAETKGYTGDKICDACNEVAEAGQETDALGYKITFKTKAGASVEHNFPVGTTADELRAWAVENAPIDAPTSTSHFSWSAYTNAGMTTVAKNATYTMSTASDKGAIRHTYDDVFSEADGMIYRDAATCKGCDYERAYTRMEASYTNAEGEEVYVINLNSALSEAVKYENSTIKVYGDIDYTLTAIRSVTAGKTVTIDLNGATVTAPNGLKLAGAGAWVIDGEGTITTGETNKSTYPVAYTGSGSLTINSGYFYSDKDEEGKGNATIFMNSTSDDAKIIINDGTFEAGAPYGSKYFVLNKLDGSNGTIEVNGGTFVKYNPIEDSEVNVNEAKIVDDTVADIYTVFDGDFSAYNAAVAEANVLNEDEYTEESWADLQTALANDTTRLQSGINAATAAIQTAIENLVAKSGLKVTVNVQIDGEDAGALEYTDLSYGDPITIDLTEKLADASIQKWTIEQADAITKLSMTDKTYEMVVTANAKITVYATVDKAEEDPSYTKVKFTDRGYKTIGYGYVENTAQIDVYNITPIDGASIVAPTIAFYNFVCWEEVAGNVYAATYEVTAHDVCNVKTDADTIEVNGSKSDLVDYDTNIAITYTGTKPLGIKIGDKVMPITDLENVHAPYGYEMVEIVEIDETPVATSMITGKFTRDVDAGKKIAAFNAMYYLPKDCTLVECGVYAKKSETFDVSTLNTATKVRSQSQSSNNEYTISMQSNYAAFGVTKVYGMSYVTYKTAGGEIITAYGDLAVINV